MEVCHWRQPLAASVVSSAFVMCRSMPWWAGYRCKIQACFLSQGGYTVKDTSSSRLDGFWIERKYAPGSHLSRNVFVALSSLCIFMRDPLSNGCLVLAFMSRFTIWDSFSPNFMTSVGLSQGTGLSQTYLSAGMLLSQTYSTVLESHTVPLSFPSHRCQDTGIIPAISHCTWSHPTHPEYWDYPRHTLLYWVSHSPTVLLPIP